MPRRLVSPSALVLALVAGVPSISGSGSSDALDARRGVVVYVDTDWNRAYASGDGATFAVPSGAVAGLFGHRVELRGGDTRDLGAAPMPPPATSAPAGALLWTSVDATVRAVSRAEDDRTFLRVRAGRADVDVHLPRRPARPEDTLLPGSRVRLRGVLEPAADAWSRPRLWVPGWDAVAVLRLPPDWDALRQVTVAEARALAAGDPDEEVRLLARVATPRPAGSFTVAAGGEAVVVDLDRAEAVRQDAPIEIRGFPATRHGLPLVADARWRLAGTPPSLASRREAGLAPLRRLADVRALPRAEAERGYPVRLEAIVTYVEPGRASLFVQDDTGGVFVRAGGLDALAAADRVLVEGVTAPGRLAPLVVATSVARLGRGVLPAARPVAAPRLAAGFEDCRRVETSGVVRRVTRGGGWTEILVDVEGLRVPVQLPIEIEDTARPPVDARVRVVGVCGSTFGWRGTFDHVELLTASLSYVVVEERPPSPLGLPFVGARDLLRSGPGDRWDRLVRARGVVLHHRSGQPLFLRTESGPVIVETLREEPLAPGDRVEVAGFPARDAAAPRLEDATYRRVGGGNAPTPTAVAGGSLLGRSLDAELALLTATVLDAVKGETGTTLVLRAADDVIEARGDGDLDPMPERGTVIDVTGILLPQDAAAAGAASSPHLLLRGPADVRVVARPLWLTTRRAAWSLAGLGTAALFALAWVATLRRRVASRTAELAAAEERYRLLADNATDVIVTTDARLNLTYVSPSVTRDAGYTIEEALSMPLERLVTPESWALLRQALGRAGERAGDDPAELGIEMVHKHGTRRFMHVRATPIRDAAGRLAGFRAAARDITARRQAQQEIARLAAAIEQSADAVVLTDPSGKILYVNPAFQRVTGYSADEVLGGNPSILKSGAHDRAFYESMWEALRAGRTWEGRFTNRRKDGRLFLEDASISPVREGAEGRLIGYVAVKRDVTRQVQLEGRLAQAQKLEAIGRLAAGIAHDFNNVLAIIMNMSDLALRLTREERTARCVGEIRAAAERAGGLTRQILTFSRQSPSNLAPLDPRGVVEETAAMLRHLAPHGVEVRTRLESRGRVAADATQLQQVVLNLGSNAGRAMSETGGTIEVELADATVDPAFAESHPPLRAGRCVRLSVRDTGHGMGAETLARIFEPFYTTRAAKDGTGMGLAVVHGIVHNHGGAITVESEPGRGSTFSVYLPALRD
ncbi:MAG: PAS domain S-box protein [Vicinamibacteria bacterium]